MSIFHQLKQQLSQTIQQSYFHRLTEVKITTELEVKESTLLSWLKGQSSFPHFYWQSRDENRTIVAMGQTRYFRQFVDAEQFSQYHPFPLLGGLTFEGETHFFLPRLVFTKNSQTLTACCYVEPENVQDTVAWLDELASPVSLKPFNGILVEQDSATSFPQWEVQIEQALTAFINTELNKVVLANTSTLTFDRQVNAYDLLAVSQQKNWGCYHFLWSETGEQTFIGSSPERLYWRKDRQFETEALAGTVAASKEIEQTEQNALWLLNDPKNRYENWLVVDDICQHLADCASDIEVGEAEIKRLHNVQHLRRVIRTELAKNVTDMDCLARIHPTAAIAGLPRLLAKDFIQQHETFQRGWYAGTLGYFSPQQAEFCVTLRSALINKNALTLYAGAGIVDGSQAESEWKEIERKSLAMANLVLNHSAI